MSRQKPFILREGVVVVVRGEKEKEVMEEGRKEEGKKEVMKEEEGMEEEEKEGDNQEKEKEREKPQEEEWIGARRALLEEMHPTAAVCGKPRDVTYSVIGEVEGFDRSVDIGAMMLQQSG